MKAPTERVSKSSYSLGLKQGGLEGERQQQEDPNQDNRCHDNDSKEKSGTEKLSIAFERSLSSDEIKRTLWGNFRCFVRLPEGK